MAERPAPGIAIGRFPAWWNRDRRAVRFHRGTRVRYPADPSARTERRIEQGTAAWASGTDE
ncbi:hypothetical protein D1006_25955 [Burkholderia stabilis]|uniref:Uncharacterized protein n=1 Tax=Burkholderia stabilis TaxID=95485 RepID=A0A4Q2AKB8_9BURK|nr:hypothetical protein D1006_25955 [Burkholderia stabilis]